MYTVAKIKVVICECCEEEKQTKFNFFFFTRLKSLFAFAVVPLGYIYAL